ncbi:MAG: DNA cytosine methyltransferase [Fimbriimonadaceae bacterium]|nr:DNA cytosine methyltransferase [Fimbriimonadaceae bacterium]
MLTSVELCAGAGGQALGLEEAGFSHEALVEIDPYAAATLVKNRPHWNVFCQSVADFSTSKYKGIDLLAGGLPCPPFSIAGKQLGEADERNLFPVAMDIINDIRPNAVMFENVRGLLDPKFENFRDFIRAQLAKQGFETVFGLLNSSDFGVAQLRPRVVILGLRSSTLDNFQWPEATPSTKTVFTEIHDLIIENGWPITETWKQKANAVAPTLVGGSKKHGGPDLGPTRAKRAWAELGIDGSGIANTAPSPEILMPKLTIRMTARIQGFPDEWEFTGGKTAQYRQIGNAFPPPVAKAVGLQLEKALSHTTQKVFAI